MKPTFAAKSARTSAATLAAGLALAAGLVAVPEADAGDRKLLLAHYMPWYETPAFRGYWGNHWTGFANEANPNIIGPDGQRDIWSNYYPIIEPYDSADPHTLECHLLQMKLAGIDGVIADWYGIFNAADYPIIQVATEALYDAAGDFDMKFAACFEDRTVEFLVNSGQLSPAGITGHLIQTFNWMQANWFTGDQYVRIDGRPLLLNFGPIFISSPQPWNDALSILPDRPLFFPLHQLWQSVNADGGFNWVHWSAWQGSPSEAITRQRLNNIFNTTSPDPTRVIPSAVPGFDDVYAGDPFPFLDHNNGETFRVALETAMDGPWETIQLVTWNDYGEGTIIEPTEEFGYTFLEIVQQARRDESGGNFQFTAEDLRLPTFLYQLRKSGGASPATLDAVSDALNAGDTAAARALLGGVIGNALGAMAESTIADAGGTITLSAETFQTPFAYDLQWERDGVPLIDGGRVSGANSPTLTLSNATRFDSGEYRLRVGVPGVGVVSEPAFAGVRASPFGIADFQGDGDVDIVDILAFLQAISAALP